MIQEILMALKQLNVNYLVIYEVNHKMCNNNIEAYTNEIQIIDNKNEISYHNVL